MTENKDLIMCIRIPERLRWLIKREASEKKTTVKNLMKGILEERYKNEKEIKYVD